MLTKLDNFDLLFLQETHNSIDDEVKEQIERVMDCIILTNDRTGTNLKKAGVAILIKNKRGIIWQEIEGDNRFIGRLLHITIGEDHFINMYAPTLEREKRGFFLGFRGLHTKFFTKGFNNRGRF